MRMFFPGDEVLRNASKIEIQIHKDHQGKLLGISYEIQGGISTKAFDELVGGDTAVIPDDDDKGAQMARLVRALLSEGGVL